MKNQGRKLFSIYENQEKSMILDYSKSYLVRYGNLGHYSRVNKSDF
jgi:hypothetical protein